MKLCGNSLPWVESVLHLGIRITNAENILESDMNIKRARYIHKNIELNQEFHFAAPKTKININNIYNSSFFGSVLWNVFSPEAERPTPSLGSDFSLKT